MKDVPLPLMDFGRWRRMVEQRLSRLERPTSKVASAAVLSSWNYVSSTGAVPFANGWGNFASTVWEPASFRIDGAGVVWLRGLVSGGTISTTLPMFTLPAGYRPRLRLAFPSITGGDTVGRFTIYPDGDVVPDVGNNAYFSINCAFWVE